MVVQAQDLILKIIIIHQNNLLILKLVLFDKTLNRIKSSIFDSPVISTNKKYLKQIRYYLKKHRIINYKIILEPAKRNTAPAILSSALIKDIEEKQPLIFFSADHLIEKKKF